MVSQVQTTVEKGKISQAEKSFRLLEDIDDLLSWAEKYEMEFNQDK